MSSNFLRGLGDLSVDDKGATKKVTGDWRVPGARLTTKEQIKRKEMVRASGRETVNFEPDLEGSFEEWKGFQPSKITEDDCIKAVRVMKPGLTRADVNLVAAKDLERLEEEFNAMKAKGDTCITPEYLRDLAVKYKFTQGKWMVMTHHSYGDRMWQMLCKALLDGELSDSVIAVKMNIHDGRDIHNVKINVATADFLKEDEVYTADKAIVDLVKDSNMSMQNLKYKADLYTHVNIFHGNSYGVDRVGIAPGMFFSRSLPKDHGKTISFDPDLDGSFEEWKGFQPSKITREEGIKEVRVIKPGLANVKPLDAMELDRLKEEFRATRAPGDMYITPEYLQELAVKYKFTHGKWMVMTRLLYSDKMWQMLCKALLDGKLSDGVISVNMNIHKWYIDNVQIIVSTGDFMKEDEVYAADRAIVDLVRDSDLPISDCIESLKYKADLYTRVNIFKSNSYGLNPLGIVPSMFCSRALYGGPMTRPWRRGGGQWRRGEHPELRGGRGAAGRGRARGPENDAETEVV